MMPLACPEGRRNRAVPPDASAPKAEVDKIVTEAEVQLTFVGGLPCAKDHVIGDLVVHVDPGHGRERAKPDVHVRVIGGRARVDTAALSLVP